MDTRWGCWGSALAKSPNFFGGPVLPGIFAGLIVALATNKAITELLPLPVWLALISLLLLALILGRYYLLVLDGGGDARGSDERRQYHRLRRRLAAGGTPALVYNRWLTFVLEKVDRFFGDAGRNDKSWIARVLHLETGGPRWTANAFDRCLLLALIYPVFTVLALWTFSGHVGVAEHALLLPMDDPNSYYPALRRSLTFFVLIFAFYAFRKFHFSSGIKSVLWFLAAFTGLRISMSFGAGIASIAGVAFIFVFFFAFSGAITLIIAVGAGVVFIMNGVGYGAVAIAMAIIGIGVLAMDWISQFSHRKGRIGAFFVMFCVVMLVICLAAPYRLSATTNWRTGGAFVLFYGLLTLVNAPIDWLAIGFTRALLRRGLTDGGWWPFFYALVDVLVATVLVALLAFAMVLAVQTFDDVAVLRAGPNARILPLVPLFKGLETSPGNYEYWWVWLLLFSSMIPSILNLSIAAAAFLRGLSRPNAWILNRMPVDKSLHQQDRLVVAATLTTQLVGGVALTGIAVYLVAVYLLPLWLPAFGAVLREFAADLAAYNAPARIIIWLSGIR
jgi:hypothetical protein